MSFLLGMIAGGVITFVVFAAFMAPKHWEWYNENVDLRIALRNASEERDHYKNMSYPSEWGPVAQHEARIVTKVRPWSDEQAPLPGAIEHRFDDIKDGGEG